MDDKYSTFVCRSAQEFDLAYIIATDSILRDAKDVDILKLPTLHVLNLQRIFTKGKPILKCYLYIHK